MLEELKQFGSQWETLPCGIRELAQGDQGDTYLRYLEPWLTLLKMPHVV